MYKMEEKIFFFTPQNLPQSKGVSGKQILLKIVTWNHSVMRLLRSGVVVGIVSRTISSEMHCVVGINFNIFEKWFV